MDGRCDVPLALSTERHRQVPLSQVLVRGHVMLVAKLFKYAKLTSEQRKTWWKAI
jgi:hypothetical protein